jgi:hypothetical protein
MALFGFIILKIFIYDLSFLEGLYRSASFAGLGVILLAVSYLYQRYRAVLLDDDGEQGSVVGGPSAAQPLGSNATAR